MKPKVIKAELTISLFLGDDKSTKIPKNWPKLYPITFP